MSGTQETEYRSPDKSKWPKGVRSVTIGETENLGLDADNKLFWNGNPVVTQSRLGFTTWQKFGAGVTVVAAVLGGFYALLQIIDWFNKSGA